MKTKTSQQKVKFPISLKLILIFSALVVIVLGALTYSVSTLVREDERLKAEENNHTINGRTKIAVENVFDSIIINAKSYFDSIVISSDQSDLSELKNSNVAEKLFESYCKLDSRIIFIDSSKTDIKINPTFLNYHSDAKSVIDKWVSATGKDLETKALSSEQLYIKNISPLFSVPALCVTFNHKVNNEDFGVIVAFSADSLSETMSTGSYNSSFLINEDGDILSHSDYEKMSTLSSIKDLPVFKEISTSSQENSQFLLPDENGQNTFYAFHKLTFGNLFVVTAESEALVFEAINRTTYRTIIISFAVFFLAIIIIRFFSKGITKPIAYLVDASHEIESGKFLLDITAKTNDEVGVLTKSFVQMGKGLAERERLKTTFSKFTNKAIAERALNGELALGGENRKATIFFSDIRSFTAISEKLQPQEVVEFLNDYMTRMVDCVNSTSGVVDKYIGDAIMAVWGAPESSGSPESDAWNCVRAALMMREALIEFNKGRGTDKKPILKIGCGINSGDVLAGQIGSSERMEYTVIGDAVNFASRTESLNKPFGTDILITENTWLLIKDKIISHEMPPVKVKGKENPVRMFAVINSIEATSGPKTIEEVRSLLKIATPELEKVDTNAEEQKYSLKV